MLDAHPVRKAVQVFLGEVRAHLEIEQRGLNLEIDLLVDCSFHFLADHLGTLLGDRLRQSAGRRPIQLVDSGPVRGYLGAMKRLLCVFAHPDDECLGPGGTIAQCAIDGGEVFITTFTAGEAGSIGISKSLQGEELARRRRLEMQGACDALGVSFRILGAPDKGVHAVDPAWAVREITEDIRRHRPQVVMTFHRGGVSGHSDHIAVWHYLERAFNAASDGPVRFFGWGIPTEKAALYERPNLVSIPDGEVKARIVIGDAGMDRKVAAIRAHVTQIDFFNSLAERLDYRKIATPECFALHGSRGPAPEGILTDLWEGLDV